MDIEHAVAPIGGVSVGGLAGSSEFATVERDVSEAVGRV